MKTIFALTVSLTFFASVALGAKPIVWETAKVISQDLGSANGGTYMAPIGTAVVAVPIYNSWDRVTVETETYVYQWVESGRAFIILPVNGEIQFYRDGNWFIVVDAKNKKHKFGMVGMQSKKKSD